MIQTTTSTFRRADLLRLLKFALVGASGYVVNLVVYELLVRLGVHYAAAAVGAFCLAVVNNYVWNRIWTFGDRKGRVGAESARFAAVSIFGLGVNLLVLHALVHGGIAPLPAQAAAVVLVTPLSYVGNRLWSFGGEEASLTVRLGAERAAAYRRLLLWWGGSRLAVFGTALVVQSLGWPRAKWYPPLLERPFALLSAWDGRWYRIVAERGYLVLPGHQSDTAFFPLYPALMDVLHAAGIPFRAGGILLANVGFALGVIALYELASTWVERETAERTALYAAIFPAGYVFSMAYPEGLVLAAMAGAGAAAARRRWALAAVFAAAATLARPEGVFVALPLGWLALRRLRTEDGPGAVAAAVAGPAALVAVGGYQLLTVGNPIAFSVAQRAWGRRFEPGGLHRAVLELLHATGNNVWLWRDALACLVYLGLLAAAWRAGVHWTWIVTGALIVLLPLESGSFTSDARFGLLALPVYAGLAWLGRRRLLDWALRPAMLGLLVAATATILVRWP
jgi:putative flippase GtrA